MKRLLLLVIAATFGLASAHAETPSPMLSPATAENELFLKMLELQMEQQKILHEILKATKEPHRVGEPPHRTIEVDEMPHLNKPMVWEAKVLNVVSPALEPVSETVLDLTELDSGLSYSVADIR